MSALRRERLGLSLLFAAFFFLVFFRRGVFVYTLLDQGDGGIWLDEADRVLAGEVLYRDLFDFVGPGIVYLNAAALALLGARVEVVGLLAVAVGVGLVLAMHAVAARVLPPRWRLGPPLALGVLLYAAYGLGNHKWPALLCGLSALVLLMRGAAGVGHAGAGALLALSTLFTQDLGLGLTAGVVAHLALLREGRAAAVVLGAWAVTLLLALTPFALAAGPGVLLDDLVTFPLERYRLAHRAPLAWPAPGPRTVAHVLLAAGGVAAAVAVLAGRLRGHSPATEASLRLCTLAGLGALAPTLMRGSDALRLAVFAAVLIPVLFAALEGWARAGSGRRAAAAAALAVLALGVLWGSLGLVLQRQVWRPMSREDHRAGTVWVETPMPEVTWLESRTRPGDAAFVLPARGGIGFLTRTRNPTRYPYLGRTDLHRPEQVREALAQILATRPRSGLWERHPPSAALLPLRAALLEHYDAERGPDGTLLLTLKASSTRSAAAR